MKIVWRLSTEIKDFSALDEFLAQHNLSVSPDLVKKVQHSLAAAFSLSDYLKGEVEWPVRYVASEKVDTFLRAAMDILEKSPQEHLEGKSYRATQNQLGIYNKNNYLKWDSASIESISQAELDSALEEIVAENKAEKARMDSLLEQMTHDLS